MVEKNHCRELTNINKEGRTLSGVMKGVWRITNSIESIESRLDELENITEKAAKIEKKNEAG